MKNKTLLSVARTPVAGMIASATFLMTACTDYYNGFTAEQLSYEASFQKDFGKFDPTNDFNLAQRGQVTVTPNGNREVCIYKKAANGYQLIARYDDVTSTRTLGFDIPKGETEILVVNGSETQVTTIGGKVTFGSATRAGNFDGTLGDLSVRLNEGKDYTYYYYNAAEATSFTTTLPDGQFNKDKAIDDFSLISTGEFIIYPTYWNAGIATRFGIYYYDNAGNIHKKVICGNHGYNESIQYKNNNGDWVTENTIYGGCNGNSYTWVGGHEALTTVGASEYRSKGIIINLPVGTKFGFYTPMFDDSPSNFAGTDFETTLASGEGGGANHHLNTNIYVPNNLLATMNGCSSLGGSEHLQSKRSFGRWWFLKNGEVVEATWTKNRDLLDAHSESNLNPPDAWDKNYTNSSVWDGVNFDAPNSPLKYDRHAVMFALYYDDKGDMVIGAEDCYYLSEWNASDYDLNDKMFKIYGSQPLVLNNKAQSWHLAFEDLGGSFDWDFNDVVLQIDHVSGQSKAHITPIAAGGTLHSKVYFNDTDDDSKKQLLGEIHELLGATHVDDDDVLYEPINASRRGVPGVRKEVSITSPTTFSIANAMNDANSSEEGTSSKNILGVYIETSGNEDGNKNTIAYQGEGKAPMMLVLPTSYKSGDKYYEWAWPTEKTDIRKAYNTEGHKFSDWVANHNTAKDWYMHPSTTGTVKAKVAGKYANGSTTAGSEYNNPDYGTIISLPSKNSSNQYVFDANIFSDATTATVTFALKGIAENKLYTYNGTIGNALGSWSRLNNGGTFITLGVNAASPANVNVEGMYKVELSADDLNSIRSAGKWAITASADSEIIYIASKKE